MYMRNLLWYWECADCGAEAPRGFLAEHQADAAFERHYLNVCPGPVYPLEVLGAGTGAI